LITVPAWAQGAGQMEQAGQSQSGDMRPAEEPTDPTFVSPYTWNVSFGVGTASGANPIGSLVDVDEGKIYTFDFDRGVLISVRAARRVWWRLGIEGEFGYASPGTEVTTTNLQGLNIVTSPWADLSEAYVSASARLDLVDARVTPFLLGGIAVVFSSYDPPRATLPLPGTSTGSESSTNPGFLFGGGLDVRIKDGIHLRGDIRGLRSNVDQELLVRGILEQFVEDRDALATQFLWTIGLAYRF
jgi:opacity protein-like surface antigen